MLQRWHLVRAKKGYGLGAGCLFTRNLTTRLIDLRSDTVTQPTAAMRAAMATAVVGDDVYGDDPTTRRLEATVADMFGKEGALFVPSGTMANLIGVLAHTWERGSEYILGDRAHVFLYEQGGGAQFGGAQPRTVPTAADGTLDLDRLRRAIREDDQHYPVTRLICLENTHNTCGGVVLPRGYVASVGALARAHGLALHVDGARIWNAMVASSEDGRSLAAGVDSLAVCLSKGLGAPAGSLFVGSRESVARARRLRKALGGAMRQSGILAAAGLHALEHHVERLADDHAHARALATGLASLPGLEVDTSAVHTNLLFFTLTPRARLDAAALVAACHARGVHFLQFDDKLCRMVTHLHITARDVEMTLRVVREALEVDHH
jgi:threonine aldolase